MSKKIFLLLWFALAALALSAVEGCSAPAPTPTPSLPSFAITPSTTRAATPTLAPSGAITLTLWLSDDLGPAALWRDQAAAFHAANPSITLETTLKIPDGKGGVLDSLMTTSAVVPALLPDAVILNASDVASAAEKKFFQPLDGYVYQEWKRDRFPFADQLAIGQSQWVAIPFAADVQHLVYNQAAVASPPRTWDDLGKQKATLLLPLGGDDAFLLQYASFGASLNNFDALAATQVFGFVKHGRDLGFLPESTLTLKSADDAWDAFAQGQGAMAQVRVSRYWVERDKLPNALNASFAPVPTRDGKIVAVANAWAVAIVTSDPARKNAVATWINWQMNAEQLTPYLHAAHRLPTTRGLITQTVEPKEYAAFLRDLLERAAPLPAMSMQAKRADVWRANIASVWRGQMTPEDAAKNVTGIK